MIPINPAPPTSPKYCVSVMHMVKAGLPGVLSSSTVPRCQVGKTIYMWAGDKTCKILGGRKVNQRIAKCKAGYAHKWQKVTRCTGGDIYKPEVPGETLNVAWKRNPGSAHDIDVGGKLVWVIGTNKQNRDFGVFYRKIDDPKMQWHKTTSGQGVRIAAAPDGSATVCESSGRISRVLNNKWTHYPGACRDVGIGSNGKLWVIGTNTEAGGYGIYRWDNTKWTKIPGSAISIAVGGDGNAWVVNKFGNIYQYDGKKWIHRPGKAIDVGAYGNSVAVLGTDRRFYRFDHHSKGWARTTTGSGFNRLALGKNGAIYGTGVAGASYSIWHQTNA